MASFFLLFLQINSAFAKEQNSTVKETLIKVAFVFKFLDYLDPKWIGNGEISFCFFGFSDEKFSFLRDNVAKTSYSNVALIKKDNIESSNECKIIYFDNDYQENYQTVLKHLGNQSIITVSDMKYFADNGGIIEFYNYRDKVRFFINNDDAVQRNIKFSAKLLELGGRRYD